MTEVQFEVLLKQWNQLDRMIKGLSTVPISRFSAQIVIVDSERQAMGDLLLATAKSFYIAQAEREMKAETFILTAHPERIGGA